MGILLLLPAYPRDLVKSTVRDPSSIVLRKQGVEVACVSCGYGWRIDDQDILVVCLGVLREVVAASHHKMVINDHDLVVHEVLFMARGGIERMRGRTNEA